MTRASFFVAAALAVTLVVAAAGIGAYLAVRHNALPADGPVADQALAGRMDPAIQEPDGPAATHTAGPAAGIAVEATEQVIEPEIVAEASAAMEPAAAAEPPAATARRARPAPPAAPRRAAARPAAPAPAPPPPRREPRAPRAEVERPAPRPVPAAAPRRTEAAPAPAEPVGRPPANAGRDLPVVDGWRRAEPAEVDANAVARNDGISRNLPPLPVVNLDPPTTGGAAGPPPPATEELVVAADSVIGLTNVSICSPITELVVAADSVIGLQIDTFVSTDRAQVEDDVRARVTRDVMVSRRVAIPAGSVVNGSVVVVERGGKLKGAARLGVRFHTVVFDDGVEAPIVTETVYREGSSRGRDNAARIGGGAVAGAILGAIFGGGRGAAIGGAAGAAGGTAAAAAGDAEPATLAAGTTLTVRLSRPVSVTVER